MLIEKTPQHLLAMASASACTQARAVLSKGDGLHDSATVCRGPTSTLAEEAHSAAPPINIDDVYRIELIVFADAYAATRDSSLAAETQPAEQWQHQ